MLRPVAHLIFLCLASLVAGAQPSATLPNHKAWIDISGDGGVASKSLFFGGGSASISYLNSRNIPFRIKWSYHQGTGVFTNFAQRSTDLSLMTGVVIPVKKHTVELYAGLGVTSGDAFGDEATYQPNTNYILTFYDKRHFTSFCVPLEVRLQWRVIGLGLSGNMNVDLPYVASSLFLRLGMIKR